MLVVHGGFWSAGEKGEAALQSRRLADLGYTVFDVQYRISPQPNWQTATGDVKCAIGWVKAHADTPDWNVDPAKLTLLGRSAGGHLALMAAYTPTDPELRASCDVTDTSVESVISLYGRPTSSWGYKYPANKWVSDSRGKLRAFLGGPPDQAGNRYHDLSPLERVTRAAPRTCWRTAAAISSCPRPHGPARRPAARDGRAVRDAVHPLRAARVRLRRRRLLQSDPRSGDAPVPGVGARHHDPPTITTTK